MAYYLIHNFIFIVVAIIHFSSYTLASWLFPPYKVPPHAPDSNERETCAGWINFYHFVEDATENRNLAQNRAKKYDDDVSDFAVIYAHVLVAFPHLENGPLQHCSHYYSYDSPGPFYSFQETVHQCTGWIFQYRYAIHDSDNYNFIHSQSRERKEDLNISAWAAGFARFMDKNQLSISINSYCEGMGFRGDNIMTFISFNETKKTCAEWIHLSKYGNEISVNINKARAQDTKYMDYINVRTRLYIEYLYTYFPKKKLFGQSSKSVRDIPWTPTEFCDNRGWTDSFKFKYFDKEPQEA